MNITGFSAQNNIAALRQSTDIIDEISDTVTYLGFCKPGTSDEDSETWSIMKIEEVGNITSFKWAKGKAMFDLQWSQRLTYSYSFQNFRVI